MNSFIRWWMTPKLPKQHIFLTRENKPSNIVSLIRLYFVRWLLHPVKRRMARRYLAFLRSTFGLKVIGITGSAGKTTTKEMIASILKLDGRTVYSRDNVDPVYNIPLTILKCNFKTMYLVLEMGVEYPGEMDYYLWLAKPDMGVITNVFPTHIEYFGDSAGVFEEKSKLVQSLSSKETAVLNFNDRFLRGLKEKLKCRIIWFGEGSEIQPLFKKTTDDYKTLFVTSDDEGKNVEITLPVMGIQFVSNALASIAATRGLQIPYNLIKKGLETFEMPSHRMRIFKHHSGAIILDDSYNNNPMAATEAIKTFEEFSMGKTKVVIFGDMLELGDSENKYHKQLGDYLGRMALAKLICVGKASRITAEVASKKLGVSKVSHVDVATDAYNELKTYLTKDTVILIKGSRSIRLDLLVDKLSEKK